MTLSIIPIFGIGSIEPDADLAEIINGAANTQGTPIETGDCLVITQKIVSKAENRLVKIDHQDIQGRRRLIESESVRILRTRGELVISETAHGFVCANAGIDFSNVPSGYAALLPIDSDRSAQRVRSAMRARQGVEVAVIISDTFGRPWRAGVTDVAIGVAGIAAVIDLRGELDANGRELTVTEVAIADEIAGAGELVMGKSTSVPVAIVRGVDKSWLGEGRARDLIRPAGEDLFR